MRAAFDGPVQDPGVDKALLAVEEVDIGLATLTLARVLQLPVTCSVGCPEDPEAGGEGAVIEDQGPSDRRADEVVLGQVRSGPDCDRSRPGGRLRSPATRSQIQEADHY